MLGSPRAFLLTALAVLVAAHVVVLAGWPRPAPAQAADDRLAGVVIDTGGSSFSVCVELDQEPIDGTRLLRLADREAPVDPVFSQTSIGTAVCALSGTGCPADDCFCDPDEYWNYSRDSGAGWARAQRGADRREIRHGDVDGWAWGGDGATPPYQPFEQICAAEIAAGSQQDEPSPSPSPSPAPADPPPQDEPTRDEPAEDPTSTPTDDGPTPDDASPTPDASAGSPAPTSPSVSPSATASASPSATRSPTPDPSPSSSPDAVVVADDGVEDDGSPVGIVLAAAVASALIGAGVWYRRR